MVAGVGATAGLTHLFTMSTTVNVQAVQPVITIYDSDGNTVLGVNSTHDWGTVSQNTSSTWTVYVTNTGGAPAVVQVSGAGVNALSGLSVAGTLTIPANTTTKTPMPITLTVAPTAVVGNAKALNVSFDY